MILFLNIFGDNAVPPEDDNVSVSAHCVTQ